MDGLLLRILRPMALGIVMFGSVFALSGAVYAAVACTLVLLLGWLGILVSLAYRLTALALLLAVFGSLMPDSVKEYSGGVYEKVVVRMKDATAPAYATQTGAPAEEAAMASEHTTTPVDGESH